MGSIYHFPPTISAPISPPPMQLTTADGSIQGLLDGINRTFTTGIALKTADVYLNGQKLAANYDVATGGQAIQFLVLAPQPGDIVTAIAYPA